MHNLQTAPGNQPPEPADAANLGNVGNAEVPWGWADRFCMPLFRPGTRVRMAGNWQTVSHVMLRRLELAIYLVGQEKPVDPAKLELEPTTFTTRRVPPPPSQ
ncbi:hypothetical protein [Acidovorax sp. Leaf160]|uniref:hypothetical protein n=1 Tax=Acidovorax sp. Leaf160 TaxID=1736280 RepID=UPI000B0BA00B|nr:hypothetical protein [Acidovorax sp. Leaf160]